MTHPMWTACLGGGALLLALSAPVPTHAQSTEIVPAPPSPSVSDLERVQREHASEIDFCLARERSLHPRAAGVVVVELTLDGDGHALTAAVTTSTFTATPTVAGECIRGAVLRWSYPPPTGPARVHTLTFVLGMTPSTDPGPDAVAPSHPVARASTYWAVHSYEYGSDPIADEVRAGLERFRDRLVDCFSDQARGVPGEIVFEIAVPGGGDIVRDNLTIVSSPYDNSPRLLRCLSPYVARIEARSARETRRVRWWVWAR
jgi:hypothetical protein